MSEDDAIPEWLRQPDRPDKTTGRASSGGPIAKGYRQRRNDALKAEFPGIEPEKIRAAAFDITRLYCVAEEIEQEVYIKLFRMSAEKRTAINSIQAYALIIARRLASKWKNRYRPHLTVSLHDINEPEQSVVTFERQLHAEHCLEQLLSRLPEEFRAPYLLHGVWKYSIDEVAAVLDIGPGVARYRIARALHKLRDLVKDFHAEIDKLPINRISHHKEQGDE